MSDFAKFIAQIGGALSAQGAGGSQGLQNFMATLAQQQAQTSQQDFARESESRQQMFTLHRDRLQREHERQMQAEKLAAEKAEKEESYVGQAGAIYHYAMASDTNKAAVSDYLRKVMPALNQVDAPFEWDNQAVMTDLIADAARTGFTVGQAREISGERSIAEDWYRSNTNGVVQFTTEEAYRRDQSNYATLTGKLNELRSTANAIGQDIRALAEDQGRSLVGSFEKALMIANRLQTQENAYKAIMERDQYRHFLAPGTALKAEFDAYTTSMGSVGESLATAQSNLAVDSIGSWSPADPLELPLLMEGYGGAPGEYDDFKKGMRSKSFQAHRTVWNNQASFIKDLAVADQAYLNDADRELIANVQEYVTDDGSLDLERIMSDLRTAQAAKDDGKVTQLSDMVRRVQNFDKAGKETTIARGRARTRATNEVMAISEQFRHKSSLGYPLFDSLEDARQAVDAYGIPDETHPDQKRAPGTEAEQLAFLQRVVSSDDGLGKLATKLFSSLQGSEEGVSIGFALDQTQVKGEQILKSLQLEDRPEVRSKLYGKLRELTGSDKHALIEAQGGAIAQVHDYNYTAVDRVTNGGTRSYYHMLPEEDKFRWRADYTEEVFGVSLDPDEMADTLNVWLGRFRGDRPAYTQPSAWKWDDSRFRGDDKRLRFNREVAGELEAASLFDLHALWSDFDPRYADLQDEAGRISDFAYKQHNAGYNAVRGGPSVYQPEWREYKPWAQGEAASYMRGEKSFRREYEASTPAEEIDQNLVNQLDRLDYMRGMDTSTLVNVTPQEQAMLVGIQRHLRQVPYGAAMLAVRGDQTTGGAPTGFSFKELGMTMASPEALAEAAEAREPVDLRSRVINTDVENRAIDRALRKLDNLAMAPDATTFYDLDPRDSRVQGEVLTALAIEQEKQELGRTKDKVLALEFAQQSSTTLSIRPRIGKALAGKSFTNGKELAALLTDNLPRITGEKKDALALEESPVDPLLVEVAEAETTSEAVNAMIDVFAETTTIHAQRQAVSLSTMTPQEFRNATLQEAQRDYGEIRVQLNAIAREIGIRAKAKGQYTAGDLPPGLQARVNTEAFNALAKNAGDPDANAMLALHIWAAHQAVLDR